MSAPKGPKKYSTTDLRDFYFSKATNISTFSKKNDTVVPERAITPSDINLSGLGAAGGAGRRAVPAPLATAPTPSDAGSPAAAAAASTSMSSSSPVQSTTATTAAAPSSSTAAAPAAGSAVAVAKSSKSAVAAASSMNASSSVVGHSADSVSPEYIAFLRQQQDLVKAHCSVDDVLQKFLGVAAERRAAHHEGVAAGDALLGAAEASTDWNWKSKFTRQQLVADAGLAVPFDELRYADDVPRVVDLQHQHQLLVKMRQAHCTSGNADKAEFNLTLENGIRRFDRLIKEFSASQLDATPVVRLSDDLVVQLDHVLGQQPLPAVLQDSNDVIAVVASKQRDCMAVRDQALDDGAMDVAERETFRLVDLSEELANAQVEKINLLIRAQEENSVSAAVRDAYLKKATDNAGALEGASADLKARCETDLARVYQLKQQVDAAENEMVTKYAREREASDAKLEGLMAKQEEAWDQIEALVKQIRQIEAERHAEIKRRIDDKVKDETRRIEYQTFARVAAEHAANLDRTIKNCDTNIHCSKLMSEFLQSGFFAIQKHLQQRRREIDETLLDAQKTHLDVFRGLLFTLGDLEYKKERRVEEVGNSIQAAHIQQELCNDSLNPNAKKFSDAKKQLLRLRDELELELRDIRNRQRAALEQYNPTEQALVAAGVPHTHPMDDLEERRLNTRAKMVEYKAMSLGHVSSAPVKAELETLRKSLNESRRIISRNASRTGNSDSSIAAIGNNSTAPL